MPLNHRLVLAAAALTFAFGSALAAGEKQEQSGDTPGFNEMDKDNDGALTRTEAAGNKALLARFKEVDEDGDGRLSRVEYLKTMAAQDFDTLREKAANLLEPDDKSAAAGGTKQR